MGIRAATKQEEKQESDREKLDLFRTAVKDVRYILGQYGEGYPTEALDCIKKIIHNPKLK